MKTKIIRSLSLLAISVIMTFSAMAQDDAKVKINDTKEKYKSEDLKIKEKSDEAKYKTQGMKIKEENGETKVKANVVPMRATSKTRTQLKTGETHVMTKEHVKPIKAEPTAPEEDVVGQVPVPETPVVVKTASTHKYATRKRAIHKPIAARTPHAAHKYIVRTKVVRDTVFMASDPEKIVSIDTEYVHDTVSVSRVDTVIKVEKQNTYTGYNVPRGNFKKVKLKKEKGTGDARMKTKE